MELKEKTQSINFEKSINGLNEVITNLITETAKNNIPIVTCRKALILPKSIVNLISEKRKIRRKISNSKRNKQEFDTLKDCYYCLSNIIDEEIREFRSQKWKEFLDNSTTN